MRTSQLVEVQHEQNLVMEEERNQKGRERMENGISIYGIMFKHGENDYELCTEFSLTKKEYNAIMEILQNHETEGGSVRGTLKEIAEEMM